MVAAPAAHLQQPPRRSTRVVDGSERESFSEQTRAAIRTALATATLQGTGLELVQFMSATQLPRDQITSTGVRGDAEELDRLERSMSDPGGLVLRVVSQGGLATVCLHALRAACRST